MIWKNRNYSMFVNILGVGIEDKQETWLFTTKRKLENLGKGDFVSKCSPFVHS